MLSLSVFVVIHQPGGKLQIQEHHHFTNETKVVQITQYNLHYYCKILNLNTNCI